MDPTDLQSAAPLFQAIREVVTGASPHYDMLSDSLIWTDELPNVWPNRWWAIRPVLHHRTCLILGRPSEYEDWWRAALGLFPQWIGFLPERRAPSDELRALYVRSAAAAEESIKRHLTFDD